MDPCEAMIAGLDAGAAGIKIELDNGSLKVFHADTREILLAVSGVRDGTWRRLWDVLEDCGTIEYQAI